MPDYTRHIAQDNTTSCVGNVYVILCIVVATSAVALSDIIGIVIAITTVAVLFYFTSQMGDINH